MKRSLVIETWNLGSCAGDGGARVAAGLRALLPRLPLDDVEVVVTHDGLAPGARAALPRVTWLEVAPGTDYYQHKNLGFDATTGAAVAFTDGDCAPAPGWLDRLTAPIVAGAARVVAGATRYPRGRGAAAGTAVDFPLFASPTVAGAVRNFFANNVAFDRATFAARRFPAIAGMFHGQCQVLALSLQADGIPIHLASGAAVEHAWPDGPRAWLSMRLLRGADTRAYLPHLLRAYLPGLAGALGRLDRAPSLALLAARAAHATAEVAREDRRHLVAGLGVIAACSAVDAVGVLAARQVRGRLARTMGLD